MLDEPVQGVDFSGEIALYELIKKISEELNCGILLISHDRKFLNTLTTRIFELDRGTLTIYSGNYDSYQRLKKEKQEQE